MSQVERPSLLIYVSANALVRNDDCHTPLDVARVKGHTNVVRTIEVCLTNVEVKNFSKSFYLYVLFNMVKVLLYFLHLRIIFAISLAGCGNFMVQAFLKH